MTKQARVAEISKSVVGYSLYSFDNSFVELDYIASDPHFRNLGVGKTLLLDVAENSVKKRARKMHICLPYQTPEAIERAACFYLGCGFHFIPGSKIEMEHQNLKQLLIN